MNICELLESNSQIESNNVDKDAVAVDTGSKNAAASSNAIHLNSKENDDATTHNDENADDQTNKPSQVKRFHPKTSTFTTFNNESNLNEVSSGHKSASSNEESNEQSVSSTQQLENGVNSKEGDDSGEIMEEEEEEEGGEKETDEESNSRGESSTANDGSGNGAGDGGGGGGGPGARATWPAGPGAGASGGYGRCGVGARGGAPGASGPCFPPGGAWRLFLAARCR